MIMGLGRRRGIMRVRMLVSDPVCGMSVVGIRSANRRFRRYMDAVGTGIRDT